jgi:hypothetical protein
MLPTGRFQTTLLYVEYRHQWRFGRKEIPNATTGDVNMATFTKRLM